MHPRSSTGGRGQSRSARSTACIAGTAPSSGRRVDSGLEPTVITLDPHPRIVLGNRVELLTTLERRLELLAEAGIADTLVAAFTPEFMRLAPEEFVETYLRAIGAEAVAVGRTSGSAASVPGDRRRCGRSGSRCSSGRASRVSRLPRSGTPCGTGTWQRPRPMLGRPFELDGTVVAGDQRGGTLGYPTANIAMDPQLICPRYGIYAGEALGHRAASLDRDEPALRRHERRIEPFLLDFDGDLYGSRLVVELWERLRDEAVFDSEEALVGRSPGTWRRRGPRSGRADLVTLCHLEGGRRPTKTGWASSSSSGLPGSTCAANPAASRR